VPNTTHRDTVVSQYAKHGIHKAFVLSKARRTLQELPQGRVGHAAPTSTAWRTRSLSNSWATTWVQPNAEYAKTGTATFHYITYATPAQLCARVHA